MHAQSEQPSGTPDHVETKPFWTTKKTIYAALGVVGLQAYMCRQMVSEDNKIIHELANARNEIVMRAIPVELPVKEYLLRDNGDTIAIVTHYDKEYILSAEDVELRHVLTGEQPTP